ncbi:MAG TPA: GC-type dockerin domain-anchored protein [Phycisphaerales bacterium]|nr:GC-type dockerin domain-anchored protein [Phycisphaerales bacterium]
MRNALIVAALASPVLAQDVATHFPAAADGWSSVVCNCGTNYGPILSNNPSTWEPGAGYGGSPGFLQATDPVGNCNFFAAPAAFLGDKSAYTNGRIEFALRSNVTDWPNDAIVVLVSSGAPVLVREFELPNPVNTWVQYSIPLKAGVPGFNWRVTSRTGAPATQGQIAAALGALTALRISGEYGATAPEEIVGLDAVRLSRGCSAADLGRQGGVPGGDGLLDNNDFIVFIDYFFAGNPLADVGRQGGVSPGEGAFDNNDFVVFIDLFFAGCA